MDRATSPNPTNWDGWIGTVRDAYLTFEVPFENYWWRTCVENYQGEFFCGGWFHA
jgi:hypothetical protein